MSCWPYASALAALAAVGCVDASAGLLPQAILRDVGSPRSDVGTFDGGTPNDAGNTDAARPRCVVPEFPDDCFINGAPELESTGAEDFQPPWAHTLTEGTLYRLNQGLFREEVDGWVELEGLPLAYGNRVGVHISADRGVLVQSSGTIFEYAGTDNWVAHDLGSLEPDSLFSSDGHLFVGADARYAEVDANFQLRWVDVPILSQDVGGPGGGNINNLVVAVAQTPFGRVAADQFGRVAVDNGGGWRLSEVEAHDGALVLAQGDWIFARGRDGRVQRSCDGGASWTTSGGLPLPRRAAVHLKQIHVVGPNVWVSTETSVAVSCDFGQNFISADGLSEATFGFAAEGERIISSHRGGIRRW